MADLKGLVQEVVDATKLCPESLQPLAFEMLLRHQLEVAERPRRTPKDEGHVRHDVKNGAQPPDEAAAEEAIEVDRADEEITLRDLHAKTKRFLQESSLTVEDLNALYYKEGSEIKPLYDDLRSTGMSESQIRIALLEAFENALASGNFEFRGESVREKCKIHKCYDSPNFTRNLRNNASLFDGFESYDASAPIRLSTEGRRRLATVISELARSA
jgi:hypothetical protein